MNKAKKNIDVVLLCGGKGQRLRPLTANVPKPLLLVNKKPFLYYVIKNFLKIKVNHIFLASGYKSHKILAFKKKYFNKVKNITVINSGNVDIIKRIQDCSKLIKNDFFVCYGDTFIKINLENYVKAFYKSKADAIVSSAYYQLKFGTLKLDKKKLYIKKFQEKPIIQEPINLGYFIFKKNTLGMLNRNSNWLNFLNNFTKQKKLTTIITKKEYFTFDSPRDYHEIKTKFI